MFVKIFVLIAGASPSIHSNTPTPSGINLSSDRQTHQREVASHSSCSKTAQADNFPFVPLFDAALAADPASVACSCSSSFAPCFLLSIIIFCYYWSILHGERFVQALDLLASGFLPGLLVSHEIFFSAGSCQSDGGWWVSRVPSQTSSDADVACSFPASFAVGVRVQLRLFGRLAVAYMARR